MFFQWLNWQFTFSSDFCNNQVQTSKIVKQLTSINSVWCNKIKYLTKSLIYLIYNSGGILSHFTLQSCFNSPTLEHFWAAKHCHTISISCIHTWMDGQTGEQIDKEIDRWMDGWMDEQANGWVDGQMAKYADSFSNGQIDKLIDE